MVQLSFLEGSLSGSNQVVRRFPCSIGRDVSSHVRVEDSGVWDQHLKIDLALDRGFVLKVRKEAHACVNGRPTEETVLKNGDLIEIGGSKIQFWLNATRQKGFRVRELLTWTALLILTFAQVVLIYWLAR